MNCPYCGKEMEAGYVWKDRGLMPWSPTGPGVFKKPDGFERLEAPGGDSLASLVMSTYPAHRCATCKQVIFKYK